MKEKITIVIDYEESNPSINHNMPVKELLEQFSDGIVTGVAFYDALSEEDEEEYD